MTLDETARQFGDIAHAKIIEFKDNPLGFWISTMMAGAFVGIGIILIFSVGQNADLSVQKIVMGGSFGIALTLVVFAGSELFTGHTMYGAFGRLTKTCHSSDILIIWITTWVGNLVGAVCLALLFVAGGGGVVLHVDGQDLLHTVAVKKMSGTAVELIARGMLCNWLVCLALWAGMRTSNDTAKCIIIFWCLFAFIAAGFEHSVANMTVFSLALLSDTSGNVTLLGASHNLLWVTIGNALSGALVMGGGYWLMAGRPINEKIFKPDE